MRSVIDQDWKAQERGGTHEAPDTIVRGDQLRSLKSTLPAGSPHEQSAYGRVAQEIDAAGTARQQLLFLSSQQLATILWAVVLVSAGGLMFFVVSESRSRRNIIQHAVLAAVILLLTFEIGSIVVLDHPFDPLARVQPSAMTHALGLLQAGRENQPEFRACGPATRSGST